MLAYSTSSYYDLTINNKKTEGYSTEKVFSPDTTHNNNIKIEGGHGGVKKELTY